MTENRVRHPSRTILRVLDSELVESSSFSRGTFYKCKKIRHSKGSLNDKKQNYRLIEKLAFVPVGVILSIDYSVRPNY